MQTIFVYGTLRPACGNHGLLQGAALREQDADAPGLALCAAPRAGFPYATPDPDGTVHGTLCHIPDRLWPPVRNRLDALEGYDPRWPHTGHYLRRRWTVIAADGDTYQAWIYLAGPHVSVAALPRIPSGDWLQHTIVRPYARHRKEANPPCAASSA